MIRASIGDKKYWSAWVAAADEYIPKALEIARSPDSDQNYLPQFMFNITREYWHQIIRRYSAGYTVADLSHIFPGLLDTWERSETLGLKVWTAEQQISRHLWKGNFDHYIICFWLVGLALALEISDEQWGRLIILIGNEGEDELLDRVIASRQPARKIGTELLYPEPYSLLLRTINAPSNQQASLLQKFVCTWYSAIGKGMQAAKYEQAGFKYPYWYKRGDENFEGGAYFGRWCIEAVAVVKAFGLDDTLCLGHEHYPGDLLRPDGPTTHPQRPTTESSDHAVKPVLKTSFLRRLLGR